MGGPFFLIASLTLIAVAPFLTCTVYKSQGCNCDLLRIKFCSQLIIISSYKIRICENSYMEVSEYFKSYFYAYTRLSTIGQHNFFQQSHIVFLMFVLIGEREASFAVVAVFVDITVCPHQVLNFCFSSLILMANMRFTAGKIGVRTDASMVNPGYISSSNGALLHGFSGSTPVASHCQYCNRAYTSSPLFLNVNMWFVRVINPEKT